MARYIDVDKLIDLMKKEDALVEYDEIEEYAEENTEDVVPVVHGEWKYYRNNGIFYNYKCSNCHSCFETTDPDLRYNYCPSCGAKMEE